MKTKTLLVTALVLIGIASICGSDNSKRDYWPTAEWRISLPSDQGMVSEKFKELQEYVEEELPMTTSVLVVRHGYIVFEKYYMGDQATPRTIWSATKSILSALIGIAMREGFVKNVNQHVVEFFPELSGADMNSEIDRVTIHHLLTMSSGLAKEHDDDFSKDVFRKALRNDPGSEFFYTDSLGPDILSMILTKTSGLKATDFAKKHLFDQLGISNYPWASSTVEGVSFTRGGYGLQLTARDMAKVGYLYLNRGIWESKQVVPAKWIEESTGEQITTGESGDFFPKYGYLWWIRPGNSSSAYSALGMGGQYIYVIPDLDVVTVITTLDDSETEPLYLAIIDGYVVPAVKN